MPIAAIVPVSHAARQRAAPAAAAPLRALPAVQQPLPSLATLRALDAARAQPVAVDAAHELLARAAQCALPLELRIGDGAAALCWTGCLQRIGLEAGGSGRLLAQAPGLTLWLCEASLGEAWLLRQPSRDGLVTGLHLFDAAGRALAALRGAQPPGGRPSCGWQALIDSLAPLAASVNRDVR